MPDPTLNWHTREAIREEVKTGVTDALTLLGISNKDETRRNLNFLAELRRGHAARKSGAGRTLWQIAGGLVLAVCGYVVVNLGFKGGHP